MLKSPKGTAMFDVKEVSGETFSPRTLRYDVTCGEWEGTETRQTQSGLKSSVLLKHSSLDLVESFKEMSVSTRKMALKKKKQSFIA